MSTKSKLRRRREELGLRIVDVAIRAGVSVTWVHLAEEGYRQISDKAKKKIATALRSKVEELFPEEAPHGTAPLAPGR